VRISADQVYAPRRAPLVLPARFLAALKARPDDSVTLRALAEAVEPTATPEQIQAALKAKALKGKLVLAFPDDVDAPVALAENGERLTGSPALVETALARVRTAESQAVPIAEVAKAVDKKLRSSFAASLVARVEGGTLPGTVGCLRVRKVPHLFLWADMAVSPSVRPTPELLPAGPDRVPSTGASPPVELDFGRLFDEAFTRLDRGRGGHNLVSLVFLRRELCLPRETFDAGLRQLRQAAHYGLSAAEGRHGVSDEEREAGVVEDGTLLLFVSRRS
jgi:hypothetical protein